MEFKVIEIKVKDIDPKNDRDKLKRILEEWK